IVTSVQPGWIDKLDAGLALKPESCKGYTIGDNTHKDISRYPWRMDDEKVAYKGYEKMVKAGIKNVCVHKGLFAPGVEKEFPRLRGFADVADVGQAANDWPQLNFIIYHSAYVRCQLSAPHTDFAIVIQARSVGRGYPWPAPVI